MQAGDGGRGNAMLLEIRGLSKHFGGVLALSGLDFHLAGPEEVVGIIGPNGAGKTTFFNLVTGIYKPSAGTIRFRGEDITGLPPDRTARRGISRTFQNIRLFNRLTALENVLAAAYACTGASWWREVLGLGGKALRSRLEREAMACLEFVGLADRASWPAESLSYGDQRRLEIARALAIRPKLIFLDEPTAGMNPQESQEAVTLLRRIQATGVAVVLIEHDIKVVMGVCDRIVVLEHGRKLAEGTPEEIRSNPAVVAAYLGKEAAHVAG